MANAVLNISIEYKVTITQKFLEPGQKPFPYEAIQIGFEFEDTPI